MPFNGSGTFNRVYSWVADKAAGLDISSVRMDTDTNDIASNGLTLCITRDGQGSATANQPMNGFRHTNVQNAVGRTDYAAAGQVQDGILTYAAGTGSAGAYVATLSPAITAYVSGQTFEFIANFTAIGADTLNINSLGAKPLYKPTVTSGMAKISSGDIQTGQMVKVAYDASLNSASGGFHLLSPIAALPLIQSSIAGFVPTITASGNITAAITISKGQASDSTLAALLAISGNTSWAVSNGNAINGYAGGTTLPNSSTIHFFICSGTSGVGTFASTSLTPTFPTGYTTYNRRIFSLMTNSSGSLLANMAGTELDGGALQINWGGSTESNTNISSGIVSLLITTPLGVVVRPLLMSQIQQNTAGETDISVGHDSGTMYKVNTANLASHLSTNSFIGPPTGLTSQIAYQVNVVSGTATSTILNSYGWIDPRRN